MRAYERLLRYAAVWTPSNEESESTPSSACQFDLARLLVEELHSLGIDAEVDDKCYVYGKIPATAGYEDVPALGLIAHMDTVSDFCAHAPVPTLHEAYDGTDLTLRGADGSTRILRVADFPHLANMKGRTLITSDGTTVLGADDKAGVAEIMTFAEELLASGRPLGEICIGFTPTRRSDGARTHSTSKNSVRRTPTRWTADLRARSNTKTSMPPPPSCTSRASTSIPAPPRAL